MDWQLREAIRFFSGEYRELPCIRILDKYKRWITETRAWELYPREHYLHLSLDEPGMVAYTPGDEYGKRDRQVRLKYGKYLRKVWPDRDVMPDHVIGQAQEELLSRLKLKPSGEVEGVKEERPRWELRFAMDRETIDWIFETPMYASGSDQRSCMHGKFDDWNNRPYHVYAGSPDVAVAYLWGAPGQDGEAGGDARIVARSVVSTKNKWWVRLYSIHWYAIERQQTDVYYTELRDALEDAGYRRGDLLGNRLSKVGERRGSPILPYIDGNAQRVRDEGSWWVVTEEEGDYYATSTDGTGEETGERCYCCNEREDDCECSYCDCCETRVGDGCDACTMCELCERCREHGGCDCPRCGECGELIEGGTARSYRRYVTTCDCDRCDTCRELVGDCECEPPEEDEEETTESEAING